MLSQLCRYVIRVRLRVTAEIAVRQATHPKNVT